jgi:hypothetical protein
MLGLGASRRQRRLASAALLAGVIVACLALVVAASRGRRKLSDQTLEVSNEPTTIQGFRTTLYDGDHARLRMSGDAATVSNARLFGPFRIGFMHSISAHNVTIEAFVSAEPSAGRERNARALDRLSDLFAPGQWGGLAIGYADVGPVKIIERGPDGDRILLSADHCRVTARTGQLLCANGMVHIDASPVQFRWLTQHRGAWRVIR